MNTLKLYHRTKNERISFELIQEFVTEILRKKLKFSSQAIYLAGSMSPLNKKFPNKNSDIDLFVIISDEEQIEDIPLETIFQDEILFFGETLVHLMLITHDLFLERDNWVKMK